MDYTDPIITPQESPKIPTELSIPEISEDRLEELYSQIKPLVQEEDGNKYTLREFTLEELRSISYYWNYEKDHKLPIDPKSIEPIQDFYCLHTFSYYGFFKPSIAEVLAQIPSALTTDASFFEIVETPESDEDLKKYINIVNAGYHLSKVRAYRLKKK